MNCIIMKLRVLKVLDQYICLTDQMHLSPLRSQDPSLGFWADERSWERGCIFLLLSVGNFLFIGGHSHPFISTINVYSGSTYISWNSSNIILSYSYLCQVMEATGNNWSSLYFVAAYILVNMVVMKWVCNFLFWFDFHNSSQLEYIRWLWIQKKIQAMN